MRFFRELLILVISLGLIAFMFKANLTAIDFGFLDFISSTQENPKGETVKALILPLRTGLDLKLPPVSSSTPPNRMPVKTNQAESNFNLLSSAASLETKAGQMLIIGITDKAPSSRLRQFLFQVRPGGIVLFRRNYSSLSQLKTLIKFLKNTSLEYSNSPLILAVDEEGGAVTRLPWQKKLPSAHQLAQINDTKLTESFGREVGLVLKQFGINMNFAPVLDLSEPNQFLKSRAYGTDPKIVEKHGIAYARGLSAGGIIPVAKHFPGLSASSKDPHHDQTKHVYSDSADFLREIDPFFRFAKLFPSSGIMISHTVYPQFNSRSSAVITPEIYSYLKKDIQFAGLTISDDLQMQGISYQATAGENRIQSLIRASFEAGCDLMMLSYSKRDQIIAHQKLTGMLVKSKYLKQANEKISRILKIKNQISEKLLDARSIASVTDLTSQAPAIHGGFLKSKGLEQLHAQLAQLSKNTQKKAVVKSAN
ncbi:MAG: glycoside hydrolase family 3 N-terminal domain-containing protein [Pseudobdellovibrionaceae bacterium]